MKKSFAALRAISARAVAKASLLPLVAMTAMQAHAATGMDAAIDAVDLAGISTKVGAAALLIVGIAMVFKGPAIAKRIIRGV